MPSTCTLGTPFAPQGGLFGDTPAACPEGLVYAPELLSRSAETRLLAGLAGLPFAGASYKEWTARRRVVSFGARFDFDRNLLLEADPLPAFLEPLRDQVASWCGLRAGDFRQALVSEYAAGTPLGWHRDAPCFGIVAGVSLAGVARMRWRPYPPRTGQARAAFALDLPPRSAYLMQGAARWDWQHAISPTRALRYSITFRTLRP